MTHKTIGLIAAPELAEKLTRSLVQMLPERLSEYISDKTQWNVEMVVDPLVGAAESSGSLMSRAAEYRQTRQWDYIISLTDLPVLHGKKVTAVDINENMGIAIVSLPAFGWMPVLKRVQKAMIQTVEQMDVASSQDIVALDSVDKEKKRVSSLIRRQFPIAPIKKVRIWMQETKSVHTRYLVVPRVNGSMRLLSGMTFANNPFKMMSSLTGVIAIAFTTGAFGMIFTTMWKLSHLFATWRLISITIGAIVGMVIWVILAHDLWEPLSLRSDKRIRRLYNLTTVTTLLIAVMVYYATLFLLFFATSIVFIPPAFLGDTLMLETSAGIIDYLQIAWFAASISTVAGAIGAGLENEELVRDTTYGYRQKRRYQDAGHHKG